MTVRISPSILASDFAALGEALESIKTADSAHVDVMDNHFVPNLTFGYPVVERLQQLDIVPLDLHLMIENTDEWAPKYAALGVYSTTFHWEAATDPIETARAIRATGSRAGVSLKPGTPASVVLDVLDEFDQVLVMTVEPGFGGQAFMPDMMAKVQEVATAAQDRTDFHLQVDGGINAQTIVTAASAGANCFVAGTAVYGQDDPAQAIAMLRDLARAAA